MNEVSYGAGVLQRSAGEAPRFSAGLQLELVLDVGSLFMDRSDAGFCDYAYADPYDFSRVSGRPPLVFISRIAATDRDLRSASR